MKSGFIMAALLVVGMGLPGIACDGATTEPSEVVEGLPENIGGHMHIGEGELKLELVPGVSGPSANEIVHVFSGLHWYSSDVPGTKLTIQARDYRRIGDEVLLPYSICTKLPPSILLPGEGKVPDKDKAREKLDRGLMKIVARNQGLSDEQRRKRIDEIGPELEDTKTMLAALEHMIEASGSAMDSLAGRIKQLQAQLEEVEMSLEAKQARMSALQRAMDEEKAKVNFLTENDEVIKQLKEVVEAREKQAKQLEALNAQGVAARGEVSDAETKVMEAKIQLAERKAAVGKTGKGELLDRLADELTMITVDRTDLEIQIARVREELAGMNPATATTQSLKETLKEQGIVPQSGAGDKPALYRQLQEQASKLEREKFWLEVKSISE